MLTSFGTFWIGQGAGVSWPGSDLSLTVLIAFLALSVACLVVAFRRPATSRQHTRPVGA